MYSGRRERDLQQEAKVLLVVLTGSDSHIVGTVPQALSHRLFYRVGTVSF